MNNSNRHKKLSTQSRERGQFIAESREIFQELQEIKNEVKEVKKLLIVNSFRRLVDNYEQIAKNKQIKLAKD
jgi:anion-transporting  ArsA/GET3 family ATPase